jgi:hypothetical protein
MAKEEATLEEATFQELESVRQGERRIQVLMHAVALRLRPLIEKGAPALRRNDEATLLEIDQLYGKIRGDGGHPASIRPYLDIGHGRRCKTANLAVAAMLYDCRPDLGWDKALRYRYPVHKVPKKRG